MLASTVLRVPEVLRKEVIVRRAEAEGEAWSSRTIAAANDRLTKPERPDEHDIKDAAFAARAQAEAVEAAASTSAAQSHR